MNGDGRLLREDTRYQDDEAVDTRNVFVRVGGNSTQEVKPITIDVYKTGPRAAVPYLLSRQHDTSAAPLQVPLASLRL